ncbi:MAG: hypothetical protein V7609_3294 [Verrucomicrobiota bacterium]
MLAVVFCVVRLVTVEAGRRSLWEWDDSNAMFYRDARKHFMDTMDGNQFRSFNQSMQSQRYSSGSTRVDKTKEQVMKEQKIEASEIVYNYARASNTRSSVEISASKGNGAKIKYQNLGQRMRDEAPTTAKQLTALTENMYLGRYHIWAEREDHPTSDPDAEFEIVNKVEKVTLQETK